MFSTRDNSGIINFDWGLCIDEANIPEEARRTNIVFYNINWDNQWSNYSTYSVQNPEDIEITFPYNNE